jgi:hypothetical protein
MERGRYYWSLIYAVGIVSLLILLAYLVGSLPYTDFAKNASTHSDPRDASAHSNWFLGNGVLFMQIIPFTTWGYGGIESGD